MFTYGIYSFFKNVRWIYCAQIWDKHIRCIVNGYNMLQDYGDSNISNVSVTIRSGFSIVYLFYDKDIGNERVECEKYFDFNFYYVG